MEWLNRRRCSVLLASSAAVLVLLTPVGGAAVASVGSISRVSVSGSEVQGNDDSIGVSISRDGRYVAFSSQASNLVPGDTNNAIDVFVRDRAAGTTRRVSVSSSGAQGNAGSSSPSISADGRSVAFVSEASNFVPPDGDSQPDVFVHDLLTRSTTLVNVGLSGAANDAPSISANGRYVAFRFGLEFWTVYVRDRQAGTTTQVSGQDPCCYDSYRPAISGGGRFVAFDSDGPGFVPRDTNSVVDVFISDWRARSTRRVSVSSTEAQGNADGFCPAVSADGRYVSFSSWASNLVRGDTNDANDVFVRDRWAGTTQRVSVTSTGGQQNGYPGCAALSADGRYVAFTSDATNLVPGDTNGMRDVFVRDRRAGTTSRLVAITPGEEDLFGPSLAISPAGRYVGFDSYESDLIARDTNGFYDVFVADRGYSYGD